MPNIKHISWIMVLAGASFFAPTVFCMHVEKQEEKIEQEKAKFVVSDNQTVQFAQTFKLYKEIRNVKLEGVLSALVGGANPNGYIRKNDDVVLFAQTENHSPLWLAITVALACPPDKYEEAAFIVEMLCSHPAIDLTRLEEVKNGEHAFLMSLFHIAVVFSHDKFGIARILLKYGMDKNIVGFEGYTALHVAAWYKNPDAVDFLLDLDVDVNCKNEYGLRAYDSAKLMGCNAIARAIYKHKNFERTSSIEGMINWFADLLIC